MTTAGTRGPSWSKANWCLFSTSSACGSPGGTAAGGALDGAGGDRGEDSARVLRDCEQRRASWWAGEIAWWRRCCGLDDPLPDQLTPWALLLAGRGREAAAAWRELGCPYEEGVSLASTNDPGDLRDAFERFDYLGARPAATLTATRMRNLGVAVPRGIRRSTRDNPAGLTAREMDVLRLISQGLHNREIAADLVVSPKTVEHHVSAVLRKLGVNDRRSASRMAGSIGIGIGIGAWRRWQWGHRQGGETRDRTYSAVDVCRPYYARAGE